MTVTPPDGFIEWATDALADNDKPANSTLYRNGFQRGARANTNSNLNYVNSLTSQWAKFNMQVNAAELAVNNIEIYPGDYPLTDGTNAAQAVHIRYDDLADKWFAVTADATTSADIRCFDSDDGITWSAAEVIITADANDESCTPMWSDGTKCAVAATEHSGPTGYLWISTDNTVANLAKMTGSFNNIAYVRDMLFDQDSSRWFVIGLNSALTSGYIESSADSGATWTTELSSTDNFSCFATDQAGTAIAYNSDSGSTRFCTAGMTGTWNVGAAGPFTFTLACEYLPSVGMFVSVASSGSLLTHSPSFLGAAAFDTDYDMDACFFSDDVVVFEGDTGTRSAVFNAYTMFTGAPSAIGQIEGDADNFLMETIKKTGNLTSNDWDGETTFRGGKGKIVFTTGTTDQIAVMTYGPGG